MSTCGWQLVCSTSLTLRSTHHSALHCSWSILLHSPLSPLTALCTLHPTLTPLYSAPLRAPLRSSPWGGLLNCRFLHVKGKQEEIKQVAGCPVFGRPCPRCDCLEFTGHLALAKSRQQRPSVCHMAVRFLSLSGSHILMVILYELYADMLT